MTQWSHVAICSQQCRRQCGHHNTQTPFQRKYLYAKIIQEQLAVQNRSKTDKNPVSANQRALRELHWFGYVSHSTYATIKLTHHHNKKSYSMPVLSERERQEGEDKEILMQTAWLLFPSEHLAQKDSSLSTPQTPPFVLKHQPNQKRSMYGWMRLSRYGPLSGPMIQHTTNICKPSTTNLPLVKSLIIVIIIILYTPQDTCGNWGRICRAFLT